MAGKVTMARRLTVPCPKRAEGCTGDMAVARVLGKHVVATGDQKLLTCPKCWATRLVGVATASRLLEVQVPAQLRQQITLAVKMSALDRQQQVLRERGNE